MARRAGPRCYPCMTEGRRRPSRGPMAHVAGLRRRHVRRRLALRCRPVMARRAGPRRYPRMVERYSWSPGRGSVTHIAGRRGRNMVGGLPTSRSPIVTGHTRPWRHAHMVHSCRNPAGGLVAGVASRRRWNVACWFSCCLRSVVTATAGAGGDPCVVVTSAHQRPICRSHTVAGIARCRR